MKRLSIRTRVAVVLAFAACAIALAAFVADRAFGCDVLLISPHDEATVKLNRSLYVAGDPAAEIYGNPVSRTVRVVLLTDRDVIRPVEDPSLMLMPVREGDARPLQVQTLYFVARYAILGLLATSLLIALTRGKVGRPEG